MHVFSNEEYITLLKQLTDEQYSDRDTEEEPDLGVAWIPAVSEIKQKMQDRYHQGMVDLTHTKSTEIQQELLKFKYAKIGPFKIMITKNNYLPTKENIANNLSIEVWEELYKTPNGFDCKIDYPLIFAKDTRFANCAWLESFTGNSARYLSIDAIVNIVRFLQIINKLPSFI
jgi:hypothetical protein